MTGFGSGPVPRPIRRPAGYQDGAVDLRTWIADEHSSLWGRLHDSVIARVPTPRWTEHPDHGGSCLAQLLFHVSLHADTALHAVVLEQAPLIQIWRDRLGLTHLGPHQGMPEAEDPEVVAGVQVDALLDYAAAVHGAMAAWIASADLAQLDVVPDASHRLRDVGGVSIEAVPWLHAMWTDKPIAWFVQWECSGHVLNHLGEMVAVRNRMGLSPF